MQNDSLETLLLRHFGGSAPAPADLETRLLASVRQEVADADEGQFARNLRERPVSRRRAVRLVALGTAGLSAASLALEGLRMVEAALIAQDTSTRAYS